MPRSCGSRASGTLAEFAGLLLPLIFAPARERRWLQHHLATTLLGEAIDPDKNRNSLLQNVEQGGGTVLIEGLTGDACSVLVSVRRRSYDALKQ